MYNVPVNDERGIFRQTGGIPRHTCGFKTVSIAYIATKQARECPQLPRYAKVYNSSSGELPVSPSKIYALGRSELHWYT